MMKLIVVFVLACAMCTQVYSDLAEDMFSNEGFTNSVEDSFAADDIKNSAEDEDDKGIVLYISFCLNLSFYLVYLFGGISFWVGTHTAPLPLFC